MNEQGRDNAVPALRLKGIRHNYTQGGRLLEILKGVSLDLKSGELVALLGPSGAGKSTLLHIAGLLEAPIEGSVEIANASCMQLKDRDRTRIRRETIGFIYQFHHLLPEFTALENVVMPQLIAGASKKTAKARATDLLGAIGLGERFSHKPSELSGGEQQRVAIARALANSPRIILADEPTGNLDPRTAERVFGQLLDLAKQEGVAGLIATHNQGLARSMDRAFMLDNGTLVPVSDETL
jgi:lipoprotein-releasing system ATP-binding protein